MSAFGHFFLRREIILFARMPTDTSFILGKS